MPRILVIDDDAEFSEFLQESLRELEYEVHWVDLAEDGLGLLSREAFDLVLLDNLMPRMSGLEFLAARRKNNINVPVILMTSAHTDTTAIQATNLGAFDYVIKPLDPDEMLTELGPMIRDALEINRRPPPVQIPSGPTHEEDTSLILGRSRAMLAVLKRIGQIAKLDEPVLIRGETGTGKDLVARAIHTNSQRQDKPFVVMNCTAFNESLLDDELFGHEAGAFTGAEKLRKGRFEHANGGTLFLDEAGDMPMTLQVKLLRVLENHEVVRIGSNEPIRVNVRVLAATHRDLKGLVAEGTFRQDLFYRLEGVTLHLPPLRERQDDIPLLARTFMGRMFGRSAPSLHPDALDRLCQHSWPGNVRQLQKVLCRAAGTCRGSEILPGDLDFGELNEEPQAETQPEAVSPEMARTNLCAAIRWAWNHHDKDVWPVLEELVQRKLLQFALAQGISQVQLARRLGMARNTLRARIRELGLEESQLPGDD